ncbi:hypothetical protein [Microbacterium foliorum]|nr:hypothetical protein [Microbacterium foliorum]
MGWSRAVGALWNVGFPFIVLNGVPVPAARDHDLFEWFAEIILPGIVGLATVAVTWAAVFAATSANRLAKDVETQRTKAAEERASEASKLRMQDMAIDDARVLHRWVVESLKPRYLRVGSEESPSRSQLEQAEIDARVALEQSLVPGADELLAMTRFDLKHLSKWLIPRDDDSVLTKAKKSMIRRKRLDRMNGRIRSWALDPQSETTRIRNDRQLADDDSVAYLMCGEGMIRET